MAMPDQTIPLAKMEERQERAAVLLIDRATLGRILLLPEHMKVGAIHYDWERDALGVRVDSTIFPVTEEWDLIPRIRPRYVREALESGQAIVKLDRIEDEDGVDYAKR